MAVWTQVCENAFMYNQLNLTVWSLGAFNQEFLRNTKALVFVAYMYCMWARVTATQRSTLRLTAVIKMKQWIYSPTTKYKAGRKDTTRKGEKNPKDLQIKRSH